MQEPLSLHRSARIARSLLELAFLIGFSAWVCWDYLGGTPKSFVPDGSDFLVSIQGRFFWDNVRNCGTCALWDGSIAGGSPAMLDTSSDFLHPIIAPALLLFGTIEGSRVAVFLTVTLGGIGSWWLARVLGTSSVARLYAGALGIVGGHLMGRLDFGLVVLVTSIATASLLLPVSIQFSHRLDRRYSALLGLVLGMTILSGQGYVQFGVAMLSPAVFILLFPNRMRWKTIVLRLLSAGMIALCIGAPIILPVLHYRGLIDKDFDEYFSRLQSISLVPINLIVTSRSYYSSSVFETPGFPGWHVNYIGWIAIAFAIFGVARLWNSRRPECLYLVFVAIGAIVLGSAEPYEWLTAHLPYGQPRDFLVRLRTPSNIANLAVPAILGLSASGVDSVREMLSRRFRANIRFTHIGGTKSAGIRLSLGALVLIPLIISVRSVERASDDWKTFVDLDAPPWSDVASFLQSDELGWIEARPLYRQLALQALDNGMKLSNGWRPWHVKPQLTPAPAYVVSDEGPPIGAVLINSIDEMDIYRAQQGNPYAKILLPTGQATSCSANGRGGHITILCRAISPGPVVIQERHIDGWTATSDGANTQIHDTNGWIGVTRDGNEETIVLRYQSPHFLASIILAIIGSGWAIWWIAFPRILRFDQIAARSRRIDLESQRSRSLER